MRLYETTPMLLSWFLDMSFLLTPAGGIFPIGNGRIFFDNHDNVSVIFVNHKAFEQDAFGGTLSNSVDFVDLCHWDQHPTKESMLELVKAIKKKFE